MSYATRLSVLLGNPLHTAAHEHWAKGTIRIILRLKLTTENARHGQQGVSHILRHPVSGYLCITSCTSCMTSATGAGRSHHATLDAVVNASSCCIASSAPAFGNPVMFSCNPGPQLACVKHPMSYKSASTHKGSADKGSHVFNSLPALAGCTSDICTAQDARHIECIERRAPRARLQAAAWRGRNLRQRRTLIVIGHSCHRRLARGSLRGLRSERTQCWCAEQSAMLRKRQFQAWGASS